MNILWRCADEVKYIWEHALKNSYLLLGVVVGHERQVLFVQSFKLGVSKPDSSFVGVDCNDAWLSSQRFFVFHGHPETVSVLDNREYKWGWLALYVVAN